MPLIHLGEDARRIARRRPVWPWLLILTAAAGCGKPPAPAKPVDVDPPVRLVKADRRTISHRRPARLHLRL